MWKNIVEPEMPNDNMEHAHFTPNPYAYKHTLGIYNIYCFSQCYTGYEKEPECYVIITLPVLFHFYQ